MRIAEELFRQTTAFHFSPHFRADLSRMLNIDQDHVALRIDSLLMARSLLRSRPSASVEAISYDAGAILVAFGTGEVEASSISRAARQLLSMKYQCEFGPKVTINGMGTRETMEKPSRVAFGLQLAEVIEAMWRGPVRDPVALTVGWDHSGDQFGLFKYGHSTQNRSVLYCSSDLFHSDGERSVRFVRINLNLAGRLFLPAANFDFLWNCSGSTIRMRAVFGEMACH